MGEEGTFERRDTITREKGTQVRDSTNENGSLQCKVFRQKIFGLGRSGKGNSMGVGWPGPREHQRGEEKGRCRDALTSVRRLVFRRGSHQLVGKTKG